METAGLAFGPFTLEVGHSGIAIVRIDVVGEKQNILRAQFVDEANQLLDEIGSDDRISCVIFESAKPGSFIAGADVHMLLACETAEEAAKLSRNGQAVFNRIAESHVPFVAAIEGACLGGGLELALACHGRVCGDSPETLLGLPEVRLGILPGTGGTQRLPRLVGIRNALELMLTGRHIPPRKARRMGLVDEVVAPPILRKVAIELAGRLKNKKRRRRRRSGGAAGWLLERNPIGRRVLFSQARKTALKRAGDHYPSPPKIIDSVQYGIRKGLKAGLAYESDAFGALAATPESQALMNIFVATTELKSFKGTRDPQVESLPVRRVGILGAGLMGAGIAYVTAAKAKLDVRLKDRDTESLNRGLKFVHDRVARSARRSGKSSFEQQQQRDRVTATLDYSGFRNVEVVIEAVFEDLAVKQSVLREVEAVAGADVIFATNTSSIPIASIAEASERPDRVIGMHYFSPVDRMPLLEVVVTEATADEAIATAVELGKNQGKTVVVVRDGPGFYVNRILAPYLNEAGRILTEGVSIDRIDRAAVRFGFPLGPFALMDEVGLDIGAKVAPILAEAFGEKMKSSDLVDRMLASGRKGKKSGGGFYSYTKRGKREEPDKDIYKLLDVKPSNLLDDKDIQDRLAMLMVNEAIQCLNESVIASPRDGDIAAVFGIGFPPFLGGPFRYVDRTGLPVTIGRLRQLAAQAGDRYNPASLLLEMADRDERFYTH